MKRTGHPGGDRFRVWIARYKHWQPADYRQVPPAAVAIEPAEQDTMSADEAATYVEAFNRAALERSVGLWAVALPVTVRYEGEPQPGETIEPRLAIPPPARTGRQRPHRKPGVPGCRGHISPTI
jgi:hypothetical protein